MIMNKYMFVSHVVISSRIKSSSGHVDSTNQSGSLNIIGFIELY